MPTLIPFFKAWILGFAIAAPVGPIGLLCVRHSLNSGLKHGLAVGLGAALADSLYGLLVGGGMTVISSFLLEKSSYIKILGGILLLYLAIKELKSKAILKCEDFAINEQAITSLVFTTFFLTLTNPMTMMSFVGVFSTGITKNFSWNEASLVIAGVFCGSISWWFLLSKASSYLKNFISPEILGSTKYISAGILGLFGFYSVFSTILS
jgi:putative LysE/RhtB family amino acid efflux pump